MHLVVLLRAPLPADAAATRLAARQGITVYEARARLSGEPPRVAAVLASADAAAELRAGLAAEGFTAIVVDGASIDRGAPRASLESMSFGASALEASFRDGSGQSVSYGEIYLLLRGTRTSQHTQVREESSRSFDAGKALLTGGLMMTSKKTTTSKLTTQARQAFLYVYTVSESAPLALYEQRINYGFLGPKIQPSSFANFNTVVSSMRASAPGAAYDERLIRAPNLGISVLPPPGRDPEEWKVDVAAAVLSQAARSARGG